MAGDLSRAAPHGASHLDEEEQQIFQVAGKALSASAKTSLAVDYEREMHRQRAEFA
jgi:hypothetical protein